MLNSEQLSVWLKPSLAFPCVARRSRKHRRLIMQCLTMLAVPLLFCCHVPSSPRSVKADLSEAQQGGRKTALPRKPLIRSVRDLGLLFTHNTQHVLGHDGAYSIPLDSKRALWLFGDTFVGTLDETGQRRLTGFPPTSALVCTDTDASDGLSSFSYLTYPDGAIRPIVDYKPGEDPGKLRLWALHGFRAQEKIYIYYLFVDILHDQPPPWNFRVTGTGLAAIDLKSVVNDGGRNLKSVRLNRPNGSEVFWTEKEATLGTAVLTGEPGYLYVYGCRRMEDGRSGVVLARVKLNNVETPDAYEYLTAGPSLSSPTTPPQWETDPAKCIALFYDVPTEMSVSHNDYLGCYIAVHSVSIFDEIRLRSAQAPWGPWDEGETIWQVKPASPDAFSYAAKEHPELARAGGRILYVTFVDSHDYWPHLLEVELM
jgi:hypothetical protein